MKFTEKPLLFDKKQLDGHIKPKEEVEKKEKAIQKDSQFEVIIGQAKP